MAKDSYRKIYERLIGKVPDGYHIHHIDKNRGNNNIENLLMLPGGLHNRYHASLATIETIHEIIPIKGIVSVMDGGNALNYYILNTVEKFLKIQSECGMWMDYKKYKLGLIPNIHGIIL